MILNRKYYQFRQLKLQTGLSGRMKPLVKSTQSRFKQLSWNVFHKCRNQSNNTLTVLLHNPLFKSSNNCCNSNGRYNNCNIRYTNISSQEQSLYLNHLIIAVAAMVGIIIATSDTPISAAKNNLKTGIPPKKFLLME